MDLIVGFSETHDTAKLEYLHSLVVQLEEGLRQRLKKLWGGEWGRWVVDIAGSVNMAK